MQYSIDIYNKNATLRQNKHCSCDKLIDFHPETPGKKPLARSNACLMKHTKQNLLPEQVWEWAMSSAGSDWLAQS